MNVMAVDEGGFYSDTSQDHALLLAVTMDESFEIRDLQVDMIKIDGLDATEKIKQIVCQSRFKPAAMFLPSACLAGFNIVAVKNLGKILPVIVVNPYVPNMRAVEAALRKHFQDSEERVMMLRQAGRPKKYRLHGGSCVVYYAGSVAKEAGHVLRSFTRVGVTPEPLRVARLIARGLTLRYNVGKV